MVNVQRRRIMKIKDFVVFEPLNLSNLILVIFLLTVIYGKFSGEIDKFMKNLSSVTVNMLSGEVTLTSHPQVKPLQNVDYEFNSRLNDNSVINEFGKSSYVELQNIIDNMGDEKAVIRYEVNKTMPYYNDEGMLKYLTIASKKVKFLSFYSQGDFMGAIEIEKVMAGITLKEYEYTQFFKKLANGQWQQFPDLISIEQVFTSKPTLEGLYLRLESTGFSAIPLVEGRVLVGFLDYESIATDLYQQAIAVQST